MGFSNKAFYQFINGLSIQRDILNFLREGELPHRDRVRAVYREAQYYAIGPLLDSLEDIQPLTGEKVRQAFLDLLPYYKGIWGSLSFTHATFVKENFSKMLQTVIML